MRNTPPPPLTLPCLPCISSSLLLPSVRYIFTTFLSRPGNASISLRWYACFQRYFIIVNHAKDRLSRGDCQIRHVIVTNYDDLEGMEALEEFAVTASNDQVATAAADFLVTLPIRLDFEFHSNEKSMIYQRLVMRCMELLSINYRDIKAGAEKGGAAR